MKKVLKLVADGFSSMADAYIVPRNYVRPVKGGFERDRQQLKGDVQKVGNGMRQAIEKHGKQQHKSSSH